MLRNDLIKNKIYGIIFIVLGALTIHSIGIVNVLFIYLDVGHFALCIERKLHYRLRRQRYEPG